jgi:hypothetical protein
VVCYNVIEHLADVEGALRGFAAAVRAGGLIFIGAPNPHSLSGVLSHYTPTWFHVWFYRHVHRYRDAGKPGHPPFPTVFHPLVSPNKLRAFMSEQGLDVAYVRIYESIHYPSLRRRRPGFARMLDILATAANALLLNRMDVRHGDYHASFASGVLRYAQPPHDIPARLPKQEAFPVWHHRIFPEPAPGLKRHATGCDPRDPSGAGGVSVHLNLPRSSSALCQRRRIERTPSKRHVNISASRRSGNGRTLASRRTTPVPLGLYSLVTA